MIILISAMEVMSLTVGTELLPSNDKLISIEKIVFEYQTRQSRGNDLATWYCYIISRVYHTNKALLHKI